MTIQATKGFMEKRRGAREAVRRTLERKRERLDRLSSRLVLLFFRLLVLPETLSLRGKQVTCDRRLLALQVFFALLASQVPAALAPRTDPHHGCAGALTDDGVAAAAS